MIKEMALEALEKLINPEIALRNVQEARVAEYAEKMEQGAKFPPVVVGKFPRSEKYGSEGIIDGLHRLTAARAANLKSFPYEEISYSSLSDMLADMYKRNQAHGLPVTEGQRNARIKLLRAQGMTLEAIGKEFSLHKSSVDRVVKGAQGEGKSGPKKGSNKSEAHKDTDGLKPKAFFKALEKIVRTCELKRAIAKVVEEMIEVTKDAPDGQVNEDMMSLIDETIVHLSTLKKSL